MTHVWSFVAAEIYHFQHERVIDFREMMKQFLMEQLNFYNEVHMHVKLLVL